MATSGGHEMDAAAGSGKQNIVQRFIMGSFMISLLVFLVYVGPCGLIGLVMLIQTVSFHEITNVAYTVYKSQDVPIFRALSWFFLINFNLFLFGEFWLDNFRVYFSNKLFLQPFISHHRLICFSLYCAGVIAFIMSLTKRHYLKQFILFGWTHVTLLIIVSTTQLAMRNVINGVIWFLMSSCLVTMNDIMAYLFGFFLGRTPLIKLSPKKTWEGFVGGGLSTVLFGIALSYVLVPYNYFVCPLEYDDTRAEFSMECIRNPVFRKIVYDVPQSMSFLPVDSLIWYPFVGHSVALSLFASIVGPFGGFFASGFKRAFKIKDFGTIIPGHGGMVDRNDCQFIMATFVFVYYKTFIRPSNRNTLLQHIFVMSREDQLSLYNNLTSSLVQRGILR